MKINNGQNNNFYVFDVLKKLGVTKPTTKQINIVRSFLNDIGVVFFKQSFEKTLSAKEIECLLWAARGKNLIETAEILGMKYSTIRTHYMRIKRKLACRTIAQAMYEAIRYSYLIPNFENNDNE